MRFLDVQYVSAEIPICHSELYSSRKRTAATSVKIGGEEIAAVNVCTPPQVSVPQICEEGGWQGSVKQFLSVDLFCVCLL